MDLRRIRLLIWKEFLQLRRDRAMLPLIFVMPALQLLMFGYVVGAEVRDLPTVVVDLDRTTVSRQVERSFSASSYFRIVARPDRESAIQPLMDGNRAQVALVVPEGFTERIRRGQRAQVLVVVDGSDSKTSSVAAGYAGAILANLGAELSPTFAGGAAGAGGSGSGAGAGGGGPGLATPGVDARVRVLFNPSLRAVNTMVPGLIALILLLSMSALMSQAVVKEREHGTLEQLFVTPIQRGEYLIGKIAPYVIVALIQVVVIMTVGLLWFRVPLRGSLLVVAAGVLLFMLLSIGQALIISMLSKTRYQAQQAVLFIMIPSMMLSGFIFPIESMPPAVQLISYAIPLRYVLVILRGAFLKGTGFGPLLPQFVAMAAFSAVIFSVALANFRKRIAD